MRRAPRVASPHRDEILTRLGGAGALLSGIAFLSTLVYTYGFLMHLGLTTAMLDDPARLLPWIARHTGPYLGLWWIYFASLVFLLPAPLALYRRPAVGGSALAWVGAVAGIGGVLIGIVGTATHAATAPILGPAYVAADPSRQAGVVLLSEITGALGLYLRLFADLLFGIWLGLTGLVLVRRPGRWRRLGRAQIGVAAVVLIVVVAKPLGLFDLEWLLGLLLAGMYVWLGATLLRSTASGIFDPVLGRK